MQTFALGYQQSRTMLMDWSCKFCIMFISCSFWEWNNCDFVYTFSC